MGPVDVLTALHARLARELAPPRGGYRPLCVASAVAGWVDDARAVRLEQFADTFDVHSERIDFTAGIDEPESRTAAIDRVARNLAANGELTAWRDERYDVAEAFGAPPWFQLERAAARYFGVQTYAAHVNGLVRRSDDVEMWIARRSPTKSIDPGRLDNLVGGGIATGHSVASTVTKEAFEEAGIEASLAARALAKGTVRLCREQPDGLQRETIFVHDLWLPRGFVPACGDGEAVDHRLVPMGRLATLAAQTEGSDVVTADASLVIVDCLLRHGVITSDAPARAALEALRHPTASAMCATLA